MTDPQTVDIKSKYPDRYYAQYDKQGQEPYPIVGWIDAWTISDPNYIPDLDSLCPMTSEKWEEHISGDQYPQGVSDGKIVARIPVPTHEDFVKQASVALDVARKYVTNNFLSIGEAPTKEWIDYQKALMAITDGTDTTSKTLPVEPSH